MAIDWRILQQQPQRGLFEPGFQGFQQGAQLRDDITRRGLLARQEWDRRSAVGRDESFRQNLGGLLGSMGEYAYTPEGQRQLFTQMAQAGYGKEMTGLLGGVPQMQKPQAAPEVWAPLTGAESPTLYNQATGETKATGVAGKPKDTTERNPVFKSGADGYEHEWDPATRQFKRTNLRAPPPQPTPYSPVVVGSPDGSSRTVFVDPRNPSKPAIDPNLPKAGGAGEGLDIPGLAPIQGAKITRKSVDEVKKASESYNDFMKQLADYEAVYDRVGTEAVGANAEDMRARATGLKLTLKELENLGVLQGPDLGLMNEMVPDGGGFLAKGRGVLNPILGNQFKTKLSTLRSRIEGKYSAKLFSNGFRKTGPIVGQAPKKQVTEADIDNMSAEELKAFLGGQ